MVGVGVMIMKDGKVLLGKRKGSHGEGEWSFPGGHLEYMESFEDCARREVREECGIEIEKIRFQFVSNVTSYKPKHYVHIGLIADWESGVVEVLEPEKCEEWKWFDAPTISDTLSIFKVPLFEMCGQAFACRIAELRHAGINFIDIKSVS